MLTQNLKRAVLWVKDMPMAEKIWYFAMIFTLVSMFTQTFKTFESGSAKDISTISQLVWIFVSSAWLYYGLHLKAMPNIIISALGILSSIFFLYIKFNQGLLFTL